MRKPFTRWIAPLAILALALTACEDGGPTEVADDLSIELKVVSGTEQTALAGTCRFHYRLKNEMRLYGLP